MKKRDILLMISGACFVIAGQLIFNGVNIIKQSHASKICSDIMLSDVDWRKDGDSTIQVAEQLRTRNQIELLKLELGK